MLKWKSSQKTYIKWSQPLRNLRMPNPWRFYWKIWIISRKFTKDQTYAAHSDTLLWIASQVTNLWSNFNRKSALIEKFWSPRENINNVIAIDLILIILVAEAQVVGQCNLESEEKLKKTLFLLFAFSSVPDCMQWTLELRMSFSINAFFK